jgi:hypothetical protein
MQCLLERFQVSFLEFQIPIPGWNQWNYFGITVESYWNSKSKYLESAIPDSNSSGISGINFGMITKM